MGRTHLRATSSDALDAGSVDVIDPRLDDLPGLRFIGEAAPGAPGLSTLGGGPTDGVTAPPASRPGAGPSGPPTGLPAIGWFRYGPVSGRLKRVIDVVVSALLLVLLAPVLVAIALTIRRTSPGPALFRQTRAGFAEQPFTMLKFRTMYVDNDPSIHQELVTAMLQNELEADGDGVDGSGVFKLVDDPRITPIGAWLRKTSLDELPQLINVLIGEMSLVGPRPSLYYEVDQYQDHHRLRAASMPGMTGLWQVDGRSEVHMLEALDLDLRYLETCSLGNDLKILARTVTVFTDKRAA